MLQRSPTYVASMPLHDSTALLLQRFTPSWLSWLVFLIVRWKRIIMSVLLFQFARAFPNAFKALVRCRFDLGRRFLLIDCLFGSQLRKEMLKTLPADFDVDRHFAPTYAPWDQRVCLVPDDDLFCALRDGRASIVTDHIDDFIRNGIRLKVQFFEFCLLPRV